MGTSRRSPMQMFRRLSQDEDAKIPVTYRIRTEGPVEFSDVRNCIYPVVKQWSWIKRAKDSLHGSSDNKHTLLAKQMSSINLGTIYGIYTERTQTFRYISSADIGLWQISEKELIKYARENFLKKVAFFERTAPLFTETRTGVFCCTKLKQMTNSLLAVPEVFNMLPVKVNTSFVVVMPTPDIILISHCHDARGLCVIGEVCIRHGAREFMNSSVPVRPIKIDKKGGLSFYEGSMVRNEATFPLTEDQLKNSKKSVFKRSRKLSASA